MTDHPSEPAAGDEEAVLVEDSEQDQARMRELDDRLSAQGGIAPEVPATPTRGASGSARTMVAEAKKHLGYRETGTNDTKFNRWLGRIAGYPDDGYGYPWCHAFVSYCLGHSRNAGAGPRTAGCAAGVSWFTQRGLYSSTPSVGDLVYYGKNGGTHVELVIGVQPTYIVTIGGNTGGAMGGNYFNGDGVYQKTVQRGSRIHGYGHPAYGSGATPPGTMTASGATVTPMTTVRTIRQQQKAVNALGYRPKLDVDGEWGPLTEAGVKWLQKKIGAGVDGEWGNETEKLLAARAK